MTRFHRTPGSRTLALAGITAISLAAAARASAAITTLDDIQFWVGSGANRAGVALDWNGDATTDTALVWGFRWDGPATGETMIRA